MVVLQVHVMQNPPPPKKKSSSYPSPYNDLALKFSAKAHLCLLTQSVFEHEMTNVYPMHSCLHSWHLMMDLGVMD